MLEFEKWEDVQTVTVFRRGDGTQDRTFRIFIRRCLDSSNPSPYEATCKEVLQVELPHPVAAGANVRTTVLQDGVRFAGFAGDGGVDLDPSPSVRCPTAEGALRSALSNLSDYLSRSSREP